MEGSQQNGFLIGDRLPTIVQNIQEIWARVSRANLKQQLGNVSGEHAFFSLMQECGSDFSVLASTVFSRHMKYGNEAARLKGRQLVV